MFCTQCGTPFEPGQNFCKHCGARVNKEELHSIPSGEPSMRDTIQTDHSYPPSRQRNAVGSTIVVGVLLTAIVVAGAVYFGTDVFRQPATEKTISVTGLPAPADLNLPRMEGREEKNDSSTGMNGSSSLPQHSPELQAPVPAPATSIQPPPRVSSKPADKTADEAGRKAQAPRDEQDTQGSRPSTTKPPALASRRGATTGTYQTTRSTTVFESASASSQVIANIPGGTRLDVVNAKGEWLEVHSRRGNPPGFIRREDAALVEKTE
jgi:hypothetical protein